LLIYLLTNSDTRFLVADGGLVSMVWCKHGFQRWVGLSKV